MEQELVISLEGFSNETNAIRWIKPYITRIVSDSIVYENRI